MPKATAVPERITVPDTLHADPAAKHRIPVIERMMDVLALLERRADPVSIRDLVDVLGVPRTTVYRILNTLAAYGVVTRSEAGLYALGPRLLALASRVPSRTPGFDLAARALPHLERLSRATGQGSKLSVLDGREVLVVAVAQGTRPYALAAAVGQRLPLHAGAAGKLILAFAPEELRRAVLAAPLPRFTPQTVTARRALAAELAAIRDRGWAEDTGEQMAGVRAVAAPVRDRAGGVVAALSVPFLDHPVPAAELAGLVLDAAHAIDAEAGAGRTGALTSAGPAS